MALPPLSIRGDLGVLSTAALRYAPSLLKSFAQMGPKGALGATKLLKPFSEIVDSLGLKDPFIRNWIDLLAFLLAGVKSNGILSAEMVTMPSCCRNQIQLHSNFYINFNQFLKSFSYFRYTCLRNGTSQAAASSTPSKEVVK